MNQDRKIVTAEDAIRLQTILAGAVETWFASLPEAEPAARRRPGLPGDTRLELSVHGRDNSSITLAWEPDPALKVLAVEFHYAPGPQAWSRPDKTKPLITVTDLQRGTPHRFTLWVAYSDGSQDQASITASTLDI